MKKIIRGFKDTERYEFDNGPCAITQGYAQIDTHNDASYFGIWANPFELTVFNYIEGDTILVELDTVEEFVTEIREIHECYKEGGRFGIDPGYGASKMSKALTERFTEIGLGDLLH